MALPDRFCACHLQSNSAARIGANFSCYRNYLGSTYRVAMDFRIIEGHPAERIGPVNTDKVTGSDVRFDWLTGHGRGVELSEPPDSLHTEEVLRAYSTATEIIVTERVFLPTRDDARIGSSRGGFFDARKQG
jgi:hypothetical protein